MSTHQVLTTLRNIEQELELLKKLVSDLVPPDERLPPKKDTPLCFCGHRQEAHRSCRELFSSDTAWKECLFVQCSCTEFRATP